MDTGRIVQLNHARGFGFIAPDGGGDDVFLHVEQLNGSVSAVSIGTRVRFERIEGQRGYKALDVTVLDEPSGGSPSRRTTVGEPSDVDEDLSEVISTRQYGREITDVLIGSCPDMTVAQIVRVRNLLSESARQRGWLED